MAKAVVMQGTDIKNRRQDMNTRQFLFTAADSIRPLRRTIRTLPKPWLAVLLFTSLAAGSLPALAAPGAQQTVPPAQWLVAASAGSLPASPGASTDEPAPAQPSPSQQPLSPPAADESAASNGMDNQGRADWRELEPGLLFGEFQLNDGDARLNVLRIDPAHFDFTLCARSQDSGPSRPLSQWGEQYNLAAAINASMYLPDGSTSTGYMRQGDHTNNGRIVQRFGAFFVAGPDEPGLPLAAILDRDNPVWRQQMERYSLVIQNYRMINADRRILWSPGGPHYSISAVAQDGDGQILFMHCRQPVEAYAFAQQVLHLPLNVRTVMYVEGGGQAGLLVRSAALTRELVGLSPSGLLVTGDLRAVLPNVLGARRKGVSAQPDATPDQTSGQQQTSGQEQTSGQAQSLPVASPAASTDAATSASAAGEPAEGTGGAPIPAQNQTANPPAPLPLAPSHTLRPAHSPRTGAAGSGAGTASPADSAARAITEPSTEPSTEPGTRLTQPPAKATAPAAPAPARQTKK